MRLPGFQLWYSWDRLMQSNSRTLEKSQYSLNLLSLSYEQLDDQHSVANLGPGRGQCFVLNSAFQIYDTT
jgi:hypothetical protein